jgi:CRP-like cAMP-binding protein
MSFESIKKTMNSFSPLSEETWADFEQSLTTHTIKKGQILWHEGDIVKHIIFILRGSFRYYYLQENVKEVTIRFFFEEQLFTDSESFILQIPTAYTFQATEDADYIAFHREATYQLYDKYKDFERLGRIIAEYNLIDKQRDIRDQKNMNLVDKYLKLINERPKVISRIPLNIIASYLAITPEHLSRIRKQIQS